MAEKPTAPEDELGGFSLKKIKRKPPKKNGRPTLRKRGPLTVAEWNKRYYQKKKRDNPDAKTLRKQQARTERVASLAAKQMALPERKYGVIYCDPEWKHLVWSESTGNDRAPLYPTSTHAELTQRDVAALAADDCALFMWTTNQHLVQAIALMAHYGFAYRSHYVWLKPRIGLGFWNRSKHEVLLIGTRGKVPAPAPGTQWESVIAADPPSRLHSAKPEIFAQMIEDYFPGVPKIELNARIRRDGWDCWGDEVDAAAELVHMSPNI
jgi:N6-adenosine-specific RNA methylase IME4